MDNNWNYKRGGYINRKERSDYKYFLYIYKF